MSLIVASPPHPAVSINSTGAGNYSTAAGSPMSTSFTHVVTAGNNRRMYANVTVSHSNWLNSYSSLTVSSSINGAFTNISTTIFFGNSSGFRQGSVTLFELINPSVGTHTITYTVSASQWLSMIGGNTRCYNNVGGWGGMNTQAVTTTGTAALSVPVTANYPDMSLLVGAFGATPTFSAGQPTPWYSVDTGTSGSAKSIRCLDQAGTGNSFTYSTSSSQQEAAIGIDLIRA